MQKSKILILAMLCLVMLTSCSKYSKLLKSTDNEAKYAEALRYYENKNYDRTLQLFDVLQSAYRGKSEGENIAYLTAECYYHKADYEIASQYYKRYAANYPFAQRTEDALYKSAMCYYKLSPSLSLDQTDTDNAIKEFQNFINLYPESENVESANGKIDTLRRKLEEKDYEKCLLYFKTEEYQAATVSFETFMKDYPGTVHREEILAYMVVNYNRYAEKSVVGKQRERYELAIEKFNTLSYIFPDSKYIKELEPVVVKIREKLSKYK